jgi:hypothetical protein
VSRITLSRNCGQRLWPTTIGSVKSGSGNAHPTLEIEAPDGREGVLASETAQHLSDPDAANMVRPLSIRDFGDARHMGRR